MGHTERRRHHRSRSVNHDYQAPQSCDLLRAGILAATVSYVAMHIDDAVKAQARAKLRDWFGTRS